MTGILLINPKYPHNVGQVIRAASCFETDVVRWTGDRVVLDGGERLPREERMREYRDVDFARLTDPKPFDVPDFKALTPVAVEFGEQAELLPHFEHPEDALYVFGPEDGGLSRVNKMQCHRHVTIPTQHCVNLSAAVYLVLYDRQAKEMTTGASHGLT